MVALIVTGVVIAIIPSVYLFTSRAHKRKFFLAVAGLSMALMAIAGPTLSQRFEQALNDPIGGARRRRLRPAPPPHFHPPPPPPMHFVALPPYHPPRRRTPP